MKQLLLIPFLTLYYIGFAQHSSITNGGGIDILESAEDKCLTPENRADIQARLTANQAQLIESGRLTISDDREDILFDWPLQKSETHTWNNYFGISNYVDQDPTAGIEDYNCGSRSYDGHKGIDIFSWPFPWYQYDNDLIEVIAGAEGVIIEKDDGFEDDHCSCFGSWNAVYVQHSDGSVAWYGHMKLGSLTDKEIGATVEKGELLGIVASSGCSTGPHLHLEVYDSDINLIEPYSGDCNIFNEDSWWQDQEDYREPTINALFTHDEVPEHGCPLINEDPHFQNEFYPGELIYTAFYYRDPTEGSIANYKIRTPEGDIWQSWDQEMEFTSTISWWYWSWILPLDGPYGVWELEATYDGETVIHEFNFGVYASVEENESSIQIYPNPSNSNVNITGINEVYTLEIIDIQGKIILERDSNNNTLDVSTIPPGLYTIRIKTNDSIWIKKFIKN